MWYKTNMYSGISIIALKILLLYLYKYSKSILIQEKLEYFVFTLGSEIPEVLAHGRMFAPPRCHLDSDYSFGAIYTYHLSIF